MTGHAILTALGAIGTTLGALVSIGVFIHLVIIRPMRHFLRNEIVNELVGIRENVGKLEERLVAHVSDHSHHPGWRI